MSCAWQPANSDERCPSTFHIDQNSKILDQWMAEKDTEDIEHIMAIISKREGMHDGVVADYHQHDCHCSIDYYLARVTGRIGEGPCSCGNVLTIEKRPGEEGKVRPDIDHLCKMD